MLLFWSSRLFIFYQLLEKFQNFSMKSFWKWVTFFRKSLILFNHVQQTMSSDLQIKHFEETSFHHFFKNHRLPVIIKDQIYLTNVESSLRRTFLFSHIHLIYVPCSHDHGFKNIVVWNDEKHLKEPGSVYEDWWVPFPEVIFVGRLSTPLNALKVYFMFL